MRRRSVATALTVVVAAVIAACERRGVEVGAPAPAYAAATLTGDSVSLEELRGQVVLLNIWATWCHPCRKEIPLLTSLHERYTARGLRIIGVSVDAPGEVERVAAFGREYGMTYSVWHDPDDRVSALYQAIGVPETYLIDRRGILRWRRVGEITAGDPGLIRAIESALLAPGAPESTPEAGRSRL